ncbi:MAG: hypothetical protein Q8O48_01395, partial [Anaerolineales bacterium]|nr:hypothetical protein [Anaerolineales bacterium]
MPLITLFSAPKPFTDPHIAMIQCNAIKSWTLLPDIEVILFGEEEGLAQVAKELGVKHLPDVACNDSGTPLISSMFQLARDASQRSNSDLLCIINADMILMPDFVEAAKQVLYLESDSLLSKKQEQAPALQKFVLLSQRWDYEIATQLDFTEGWESRLWESVRKQNQLHRPAGSDFFLFPKSCYQDIPDLIIGRAGWDNWMIYKACQEKWPVIDCTP